MEKFDLDDQPEAIFETLESDLDDYTDPDALAGGAPADSVYNEDEYAFLKETIGEDYAEDPRNTYRLKNDTENWPQYEYETDGGKTIKVKHDKIGTMWHIEFSPGGQLPRELNGKFTTDRDAIQAVEIYLARK